MVTKTQSRQQQSFKGIKSKLMAAVCMLLVSAIMMVSSTYAWFTLSTAPEVTGITTAVGANGNLEIALLPLSGKTDDIKSGSSDSMAVQTAASANTTWGNLVDVTEGYGLDEIILYPSKMATTTTGDDTAVNIGNPLMTPTYGADGRVASLTANTLTGVYQNGSFNAGTSEGSATAYGVRAVGTSSDVTERYLAYQNALVNASAAGSTAKTTASRSLNANGQTLANIAVKHVLAEENSSETYTEADITAMKSIVNALLGYDTAGEGEGAVSTHTTGALEYIEQALKYYVLADALAASTATNDNYQDIKNAVEAATLDALVTGISVASGGANISVKANSTIAGYVGTLNTSKTSAASALAALNTAVPAGDGTYAWSSISSAMGYLLEPTKLTINGMTYTTIKEGEGMSTLVSSIVSNGVTVSMPTGSGIYADIADFCGDYSANITVVVNYGSFKDLSVDATMNTKTSAETTYLAGAKASLTAYVEEGGGSSSKPITDFYGYIIDLAFRTNASDSYLQLQTEAVDRIYEGGSNTNTMGGGASMTFTSLSTSFSGTALKNLMGAIRVVFFDPDTGEIIGYARLDPASASSETTTTGGTGEAGTDSGSTASKITMDLIMTDDKGVAQENANIMKLDQNAIHKLSVMVYLDGDSVGNDDVAVDAVKSMTGSMNLQFSSSADLVPMNYSDLMSGNGGALNGSGSNNNSGTTPTAVTVDNNSTEGYSYTAYYYNRTLGVVITDSSNNPVSSGVTVTINGAGATYGTIDNHGAWVVTVSEQPTSVNVVVATTQ